MIDCPRCAAQVTELQDIDPGLASKLAEIGEIHLPPQVCTTCINILKSQFTELPPLSDSKNKDFKKGGLIMAQERAKIEYRENLWKTRVQFLKAAREAMTNKQFSEAAICYEKYLKILEIVFELKEGEQLRPLLFKEKAKTTELTVVSSVYWDLLRIYDSNPKYQKRMQASADQLANFVQYTPIYTDIVRRAQSFVRSAKNPQIVKYFLKKSVKESNCFIATSAFGPAAFEVQELRKFRDTKLNRSFWGRKFIQMYYEFSPIIARILDKNYWVKPYVRSALRLLIKCVS